MITEYLLALIDEANTDLTPIAIILDGPLIYCGNELSANKLCNLKAYLIVRQFREHQLVCSAILESAHRSVISMIGPNSVAMLETYEHGITFRTATPTTSLLLRTPIQIVSQYYHKKGATLSGTHEIDLAGYLKVVFESTVTFLYLLDGKMYDNGTLLGSTTERACIEKAYEHNRKAKMGAVTLLSANPGLTTQTQKDHFFSAPPVLANRQSDNSNNSNNSLGGGIENGNGDQTKDHLQQLSVSRAKQVAASLSDRFQFSTFLPVDRAGLVTADSSSSSSENGSCNYNDDVGGSKVEQILAPSPDDTIAARFALVNRTLAQMRTKQLNSTPQPPSSGQQQSF